MTKLPAQCKQIEDTSAKNINKEKYLGKEEYIQQQKLIKITLLKSSS